MLGAFIPLAGYNPPGVNMQILLHAVLWAAWHSGLFLCMGFEDECVDGNEAVHFALRRGTWEWGVPYGGLIHRCPALASQVRGVLSPGM